MWLPNLQNVAWLSKGTLKCTIWVNNWTSMTKVSTVIAYVRNESYNIYFSSTLTVQRLKFNFCNLYSSTYMMLQNYVVDNLIIISGQIFGSYWEKDRVQDRIQKKLGWKHLNELTRHLKGRNFVIYFSKVTLRDIKWKQWIRLHCLL